MGKMSPLWLWLMCMLRFYLEKTAASSIITTHCEFYQVHMALDLAFRVALMAATVRRVFSHLQAAGHWESGWPRRVVLPVTHACHRGRAREDRSVGVSKGAVYGPPLFVCSLVVSTGETRLMFSLSQHSCSSPFDFDDDGSFLSLI